MKIKLTLSYDGSGFYGSQIQPDKITIQSTLEEVLKVFNIKTKLEFSGRTDKGVHAFKQVVSADIPNYFSDLNRLKIKINKLLPNTILIRSIYKVNDDFHARFSAKKREYRYLISKSPTTPFNQNFSTYYENVDREKIEKAISYCIGIHDFEYFSKKGSDPLSTVREIYDIKFYEYKGIYILKFKANSYLRSQIRMMVDFIMKVSSGKLTIKELQMQLNKEKLVSWTLAPASGLYLSKISY